MTPSKYVLQARVEEAQKPVRIHSPLRSGEPPGERRRSVLNWFLAGRCCVVQFFQFCQLLSYLIPVFRMRNQFQVSLQLRYCNGVVPLSGKDVGE